MRTEKSDGCDDSYWSLSLLRKLRASPPECGGDTTTVPTIRKLLILLVLAVGCASAPPKEPCRLLIESDISAVQGAAPVSATATSHKSGDITVSQCFYLLPEQSRSVTLEITSGPHVHELWEKQFEPGEKEEKGSGETHAIEVKGIGRDAFWGGNRVSGALYVEVAGRGRRDFIMRISIGGAGDVATKIEHAKTLARAALERMN